MQAMLLRPGGSALCARLVTGSWPLLSPCQKLASYRSAGSSLWQAVRHQLRQQSRSIVLLSVTQCEFLLMQRVKRSIQVFQLYSRLYERDALRELVRCMARLLSVRGRQLVLATALLKSVTLSEEQAADADGDRETAKQRSIGGHPSDEEAPPAERHGYEDEFGRFQSLQESSIYCPDCGRRQLIDKKVGGVFYCACNNGEPTPAINRQSTSTWTPFLENSDAVFWRQQHPQRTHLYSYKVYGSYSDISADAFCEVQLNTQFRQEWDFSVQDLRVVESQPRFNSDIVYWLVKFPRMFSNRDYVFERRFYRDTSPKQLTIVSRSVSHPACPQTAGVVRVHDYWSVMVIRPHTDFHQPGLDYGLTYFDDPGTQLPRFVTNYVAASGMPDFLQNVAAAARRVQRQVSVGRVTIPLQYLHCPGLSSGEDSGEPQYRSQYRYCLQQHDVAATPQSAGSTAEGQQSAGSTDEGQQSAGSTDEGQQSAGSTDEGQQSADSVTGGPQSESTTSEGPQSESTTSEGPQSESTTSEGPQSESPVKEAAAGDPAARSAAALVSRLPAVS